MSATGKHAPDHGCERPPDVFGQNDNIRRIGRPRQEYSCLPAEVFDLVANELPPLPAHSHSIRTPPGITIDCTNDSKRGR